MVDRKEDYKFDLGVKELNFIWSNTLKEIEEISYHNSSFPSVKDILWCFFYLMAKFTVSLISLSPVICSFAFLNNLEYCCLQMHGAYKCVQLLTF